jgi:hypothetical protein
VRATLAGWGLGEVAEDAEAIASEMTSNAVAASAPVRADGDMPVIRVCLVADRNVLTIECWDQAPGEPMLREAAGFAESGRGLAIINALTDGAWGWHPATGQRAKCVWAQIPLRDAPARQYLALDVTGRDWPVGVPCLAEPPISAIHALSPAGG